MIHSAIERTLVALDEYRQGRMVILVDDEDRENEGDLCVAAEKVTPEAINFMATFGRGLICLALDEYFIDKLKLPMMVHDNQATLGTAFTVSIEARHGVTTGISAKDRATTVLCAIADDARPEDLVSPGHVFPLRARRGGVLVRTGQTEGSVDLARLGGLKPASVICEIMRADGEMARMPDLETFAADHGVAILSIADMIAYRLQQEMIVERRAAGQLRPAMLGPGEPLCAFVYSTTVEDAEYLALVRGDVRGASAAGQEVLVRVQSMCAVGDAFATGTCYCEANLRGALRAIDAVGLGVFLYVYPRARTSLVASFRRHVLHEPDHGHERSGGQSEVLRDFGLGAQVLADLGCKKICLLSNAPRRIAGLEGFGIDVTRHIPIPQAPRADADAARLRAIAGGKASSEPAGPGQGE
jgi:3,4-dihydroxy 2-butanone 4-phosphate synthase/GTP cyclohydrolase II